MIRRYIAAPVGAGLLVVGALLIGGCSGDSSQASRESISAPRKGGGVIDTAGEKFKAKPKAKGVKTKLD